MIRNSKLILFLFLLSCLKPVLAQSPHGANFVIECSGCHTANGWNVNPANIVFNHGTTGFALSGQHKTVGCRQCHTSMVFTNIKSNCSGCHRDLHKNSVGTDCQRCHTTQNWMVSNTNLLHQSTRFPLVGNHMKTDCGGCHGSYKELNFSVPGISCYRCHVINYETAKNPNHVESNFSKDCDQCHRPSATSWLGAQFKHEQFTDVACYICHSASYNSAKNPDHLAGGYPKECRNCHTSTSWKPSSFNHSTTAFPLTGSHETVICNKCHTTQFAGTTKDCKPCHLSAMNAATNPDHKVVNFPQTCITCHSTTVWKPSSFNHGSTTFPLTGVHQTILCNSCHSIAFAGTVKECKPCHLAAMNAATNPDHKVGNFPQVCTNCHTTSIWKPSSFNHGSTAFALSGVHQTTECNKCHSQQFLGTRIDCYGCHQAKFEAAVTPNHVAGSYPKDCRPCHNSNAWNPAAFDHNFTSFPLTGTHQATLCEKCHINNVYTGTTNDCKTCHLTAMNAATNPDHKVVNFPQTCLTCHNTTTWKPSSFNHVTTTFPLTGAHSPLLCNKCHSTQFAGTALECYGCHQSNFTGTTNPNHVTGGFPTTCKQCHSSTAWKPATLDHNLTRFPLTGSHQTTLCEKCHVNNIYTGTPLDCNACHHTAYINSTNPNHVAGAYPTTCNTCHTTTAWVPSNFNHSSTGFTIDGGHTTVTCAQCHPGTIAHVDPACKTCHTAKFTATTNPKHVILNLSLDCITCHTTATGWKPAKYTIANHAPGFVFGVAHTSLANNCTACHSSGTYPHLTTARTCDNCHHTKYTATTNPPHTLVAYSTTCSSCHPISHTGWTPADTYAHPTYNYKTRHSTKLCKECHTSNTAGYIPQCISCHLSSFNKGHSSSHSKDCWKSGCHTSLTTWNKKPVRSNIRMD